MATRKSLFGAEEESDPLEPENVDLVKAHLQHVSQICDVLAESVMTQGLGIEEDIQDVFDALKEAANMAEATAKAL